MICLASLSTLSFMFIISRGISEPTAIEPVPLPDTSHISSHNKRNLFTADPINNATALSSSSSSPSSPLCPAYFESIGESLMMHSGSWSEPQSDDNCLVTPSPPTFSAYDSSAFHVDL